METEKECIVSTSSAWMYVEEKDGIPLLYAEVMDVEGDVVRFDFKHDRCAYLDMTQINHIILTKNNLWSLYEFIELAEDWYNTNLKEYLRKLK